MADSSDTRAVIDADPAGLRVRAVDADDAVRGEVVVGATDADDADPDLAVVPAGAESAGVRGDRTLATADAATDDVTVDGVVRGDETVEAGGGLAVHVLPGVDSGAVNSADVAGILVTHDGADGERSVAGFFGEDRRYWRRRQRAGTGEAAVAAVDRFDVDPTSLDAYAGPNGATVRQAAANAAIEAELAAERADPRDRRDRYDGRRRRGGPGTEGRDDRSGVNVDAIR